MDSYFFHRKRELEGGLCVFCKICEQLNLSRPECDQCLWEVKSSGCSKLLTTFIKFFLSCLVLIVILFEYTSVTVYKTMLYIIVYIL